MNCRNSKMSAALFGLVMMLIACTKNNSPLFADEPQPGADTTATAAGSFVSNVHQTSGTAKVTMENGKRYLVFQNFRTDNGPDLRVWLSVNTGVSDYRELGPLRAVSGNFSYELAGSIDLSRYKYVLIWCEDFSVLFGHAVLQ